MLPSPRESMQSANAADWDHVGHRGRLRLVTVAIAAVVWVSCSAPESYRGTPGSLSSGGASGAAGVGDVTGAAGSDTTTGVGGGAAGAAALPPADAGAAGSGDVAGGSGADAAAGSGAAGNGAAGTGAAGMGVAGGGAAGAGATGGGAGASGQAGASGSSTGAAGALPTTPLALPFAVSDHFHPTGAMNDAITLGAVTTATDPTACTGVAAGANPGLCLTITYHPQIVAPATTSWGGVYWQYPDNNWGALTPLRVAPGAKDVSFWAKGMAGGEVITFQAGGIMNTPSTTTPYTDTFKAQLQVTLTNAWKKYTMPLTGMTYDAVLGGFCWVANAPNANVIGFYLDGVVWE
jgi:hypothetical protein